MICMEYSESEHAQEIQKLCAVLGNMGSLKIYGNDAKSETLSFKLYKMYATEQSTDFAADCLRKIGFTNVSNDKEKNNFFHSVKATIVCEYDLNSRRIKNANMQDVKALYNLCKYANVRHFVFLPKGEDREMVPHWKHKSDLCDYLRNQSLGR